MIYQEKFWILISKKLSGEATGPELLELNTLIAQHPEWQYAIQNLEDLWKHKSEIKEHYEEDAYLLHLHRMSDLNIPFVEAPVEIPAGNSKSVRLKWYWVAAISVAASFMLWIFFTKNNAAISEKEASIKEVNEISTRPGSKSKVQLPDGTVVWLNAGSQLTYNKDYGKVLREVSLLGEGFFEVSKNKNVPFIIHAANINIKVLGTVFNVKAYPEDKKTETSLIEGSIEVTIKNRPNDKIYLSPSEKLIVNNGLAVKTGVINKKDIVIPEAPPIIFVDKLRYNPADSTVAETMWKDNKLVFRDESFAELALKFDRWYDVKIEIHNDKLLQERFTATFETETIEQALDALKISTPYHYEKTGNKINIY